MIFVGFGWKILLKTPDGRVLMPTVHETDADEAVRIATDLATTQGFNIIGVVEVTRVRTDMPLGTNRDWRQS